MRGYLSESQRACGSVAVAPKTGSVLSTNIARQAWTSAAPITWRLVELLSSVWLRGCSTTIPPRTTEAAGYPRNSKVLRVCIAVSAFCRGQPFPMPGDTAEPLIERRRPGRPGLLRVRS